MMSAKSLSWTISVYEGLFIVRKATTFNLALLLWLKNVTMLWNSSMLEATNLNNHSITTTMRFINLLSGNILSNFE